MSDLRRLLDDPNVSIETRELVDSLDVPERLSEPTRAVIGARLARSLALPVAAGAFVSLKTAGAVAALLVGGTLAVSLVVDSEPVPAAPVVKPAPAAPVRTPPPAPVLEHAAPEPPPAVEEAPPDTKNPAPRATSRRDTLALEESLLEQARRSMSTPSRALSLLREHERRFPNGELTAERLYLTAQTHARAGNGTAARHYARLLAGRFPKSTYVPRVRSLLEGSAGAATAPAR